MLVDLDAANIHELLRETACSRFIAGNMVEPDEDGCLAAIMIQTSRIQCAVETGLATPCLYP
jgi:hypothetical protein